MRRIAVLLFALVGVALLAGGAFKAHLNSKQTIQDPAEKPGTIKEMARRARSMGQQQVVVPGLIIDYGGSNIKLDEALAAYQVVIAEAIDERPVFDGESNIMTWYKFKPLEELSQNKTVCSSCSTVARPPSELLPLKEGEFVLPRHGGSINIEGVQVTVQEGGKFPAFERGAKYLLILSADPSGAPTIPLGPNGIFRVTADGTLKPINNQEHPVKQEMQERFANSIGKLRSHLRNKVD